MKRKRILAAGLLAAASVFAFAGCGSSSSADTIGVVVSAGYVDDEALQAFADALIAGHPDWEGKVTFTAQSMGDENLDGMGYGAAVMQQTAMAAAGEMDIMVCDDENGARNSRSDLFIPLSDLFTDEEIASFGETLAFEMVDESGSPTGEMTPTCGVRVTGDGLDAASGGADLGVYIVSTDKDETLVKEIFETLIDS